MSAETRPAQQLLTSAKGTAGADVRGVIRRSPLNPDRRSSQDITRLQNPAPTPIPGCSAPLQGLTLRQPAGRADAEFSQATSRRLAARPGWLYWMISVA
jgi:hypothetical protein